MSRSSLCFLLAVASTASAATRWQDEVVSALVETDPDGEWEIAPLVTPVAGSGAKADILIEAVGDGSTSVTWTGAATRTSGVVAATSLDGRQALLVAESVLVCDSAGCEPLPSIDPDEIDFQLRRCAFPICGGVDVLAEASAAYLVVDVTTARDGSSLYTVTDLLIGFGTAVAGVEPEEID